ncbi:MAG: BBP7 family outer membrane beta-barrel protein [Planctomycetales bacterium]|nr:BBP7 family outer membrane beta-barrel protein [Planctomycetales bacterium]
MPRTSRSIRHLAKLCIWAGVVVSPTLLHAATPIPTQAASQPGAPVARAASRPAPFPRAARSRQAAAVAATPAPAIGRNLTTATANPAQTAAVAPAAAVMPANHTSTVTPIPATTDNAGSVQPASAVFCDDAGAGCDAVAMPTLGGGLACLPIWGQFEYLMWWDKDSTVPTLASTSPAGTDRTLAGILGQTGTTSLFDSSNLKTDTVNGGRITLGLWMDGCQSLGIMGRAFFMEDQTTSFSTASTGTDILARPFFNSFTNEQDALLLAFPDLFAGSLDITHKTEVNGAEVLIRQAFRGGCNYRVDLIYGYRYVGVDESLRINDSFEFTDAAQITFGNTIDQTDLFDVTNEFHGGEIGLAGHSTDGRWSLDFQTSVALGSMKQTATISGSTTTTPPAGAAVTSTGGLLTQASNIGTFTNDPFTVIPEATVTLGYMISPRLDLSVGYTFLYIDNVARAGKLVDNRVNLTQQTGTLDGPATPELVFNDVGYWLQGVNFGLNLRY